MKYKAIISDLDGTLLNEHHSISEETKKIVKEVIDKKGVKFFIATGRHHCDAITFKKQLGLDSYMITANGAKVHNVNNDEIMSRNLDVDLTQKILEMDIPKSLHKHIYMDNHWYVEVVSDELKEYHRESGFKYEVVKFSELKGKEVTKFFYIGQEGEQQTILDLEKRFREKFPTGLNITMSMDLCLEIMKEGVSKASAIEEVLKKEGISLEETIAFGDGLNDLEMLSSVGKGFVMGNASERLKKALPNNEIIRPNSEHGVALKLQELFLNDN